MPDVSNLQVRICNSALLLVGADTIESFSDETDRREALLCARLYETTRDQLLQNHPWGFSITTKTLAKTVNTPVDDYEYEYQIPPEVIRIITAFQDNDYEIRSDKIVSNVNNTVIAYTIKAQVVPAESEFPPYFTRALELELAKIFAAALRGDEEMANAFKVLASEALVNAKLVDSQQQPSMVIAEDDFFILNDR